MKAAVRPAWTKLTVEGKLYYACREHAELLDVMCEDGTKPQPVPSHERDDSGVWCSFCNRS